MLRDPVGNGTDQQAFEASGSTRTNHKEVRGVARLEQRTGRKVVHHPLLDRGAVTECVIHPRCEHSAGSVVVVGGVERDRGVCVPLVEQVPHVQRFKPGVVECCFLGRPPERDGSVVGAVGTYDDALHDRVGVSHVSSLSPLRRLHSRCAPDLG